jgi:glucose/arabinose dehydrogenase
MKLARNSLQAGTALLLGLAVAGWAAPIEPNFNETVVVDSLNLGSATGVAWAPDGSGRLFVSRKSGEVMIVKNGALNATPFATVSPVFTDSECGLIGICFDPNFVVNHYVYLFVTVSAGEQQIIRYTANGDLGTGKTVLIPGLPTLGNNHDGGAVGIGPDGKLYWAIGDQGNGTGVDADLTTLAAKVGRANRDGSVPNDNPFYDGAGPNNDYIWARGFRNPFTFTFQRGTGKFWVNVVGTLYEQIFVVNRGDHAGWNDYENNQPAGFITPVIVYRTNGSDTRTIAAGGAVRAGNVVTFTTTAAHGFRKGGKITVSGVGSASFNGSFYVAAVPSATTFTVNQTGPNQTSGGGSAVTLNQGGCVTGGTFYDSTAWPASYRGNFFYGDFNSGRIMRAVLDATNGVGSVDYFADGIAQCVDMAVGPDGALYYIGVGDGVLYRMDYDGTAQNLIVFPTAFDMVEGGTAVFTVRLAQAPAANVTVSVARTAGDTNVVIAGGSTLTFTPANYATPQSVTLNAAEDADVANDSATLTVSSSGLPSYGVTVNAIDNDTSSLVVSATALSIIEGSSGTFTVRLASQPAGNVTVTVARTAGDTDIRVTGGASLTFTTANYATPQTVTVAALEDADLIDDAATVSVSAPGATTRTVAVTAADNDPRAPAFTSTPVTNAIAGAAYAYDADADGNPAPTYSLPTAPAGMSIDAATGEISWTPAATGSVSVAVRAANGVAPNATQSFAIAVAADMPPVASMTAPTEGATVSGTNEEWFGDGFDDVGTVKAEFYVDNVLRYTDVNSSGHYHYGGAHLLWDTTTLTDGPHALKMTVYDTKGQSGFQIRNVTVNNSQPSVEVIVDNADGPATVTIVGDWRATSDLPGYWGPDYLHDRSELKGSKSVRFQPNLPQAGDYDVQIWYLALGNATTNTPVDIVHAGVTNTVAVNQRVNGTSWFSLGRYTFAAGTNGSALVRTGGTRDYVLADAVRFVKEGAPSAPELSVSPLSLSPACVVGSDAAGQSFEVWNSGGSSMSYTVADNVAWLSCSPTSGSSTGEHDTIAVAYATSGLSTGTYSGTITISAAGAGSSPQQVTVILSVLAASPADVIVDNADGPATVTIVGDWRATSDLPGYWGPDYLHDRSELKGSKSVRFRPNLPQAGDYDVQIWYLALGNATTNTPVDIVHAGGTNTVAVNQRVNGSQWFPLGRYSFAAGTNGSALVRTGGTRDYVLADAVRFVQQGSGPPPELSVSQPSLAAACVEGNNAAAQSFEVRNSGGSSMSYTVADDVPWLSCSPTSGSSTGEHDTIVVAYATSALSAGTYSGTITISAPGATSSPLQVEVTLTVSASALPSVIVDNADGPATVTIVGDWRATSDLPGFWGPDYLHDRSEFKGTKSVRFRPNLPQAGDYDVQVWYLALGNASTNTPVDIVHAGGTNTVAVNQRVNGSQWFPVGRYTFAAGTSGSVLVRTDGTRWYVLADAVRFQMAGGAQGLASAESSGALSTAAGGAVLPTAWVSGSWSREYGEANLIDGDTETFWLGNPGGSPWAAYIDFGQPMLLNDVAVLFHGSTWTNLGMVGSADSYVWSDLHAVTNWPFPAQYLYFSLWEQAGSTDVPAIREILWNEEGSDR